MLIWRKEKYKELITDLKKGTYTKQEKTSGLSCAKNWRSSTRR